MKNFRVSFLWSSKSWKKALPYLVFFCGLVLSFAALLGDQVDEMPLAYWLFARSSYYEQQGISSLLEGAVLNQGSEGFEQITRFLRSKIRRLNADDVLNPPVVYFSDLKLGDLIIGMSGDSPTLQFKIRTSVGEQLTESQQMTCTLQEIKKDAEDLKVRSILPWRFALFFIGAIIETYGCFMENRETQESIPRQYADYEE